MNRQLEVQPLEWRGRREDPEVLSCPSRQLQSLLRRFTAGTDDDEWRRTRLPCFYGKSNMFTCFTWVRPEGRVTHPMIPAMISILNHLFPTMCLQVNLGTSSSPLRSHLEHCCEYCVVKRVHSSQNYFINSCHGTSYPPLLPHYHQQMLSISGSAPRWVPQPPYIPLNSK